TPSSIPSKPAASSASPSTSPPPTVTAAIWCSRPYEPPARAPSMIRIANGQGFWGDWLEAPVRLIAEGPIDYLVLDYLAEVTMSILQKQKEADPKLGYARDFPPLIARTEKMMRDRNVK